MIAIEYFVMPKCCSDCVLNSCLGEKHYCNITTNIIDFNSETRPKECPLVDVTPNRIKEVGA